MKAKIFFSCLHYQLNLDGLNFPFLIGHCVLLFCNCIKPSSCFVATHPESAYPPLPATLNIASKLSSKQEDHAI